MKTILIFLVFVLLVGPNSFATELKIYPDQVNYKARFAWNVVDHPELIGYRLYWGTTSGHYSNHITVFHVQGAAEITGTVAGLKPNTHYYFVATAFTSSGVSSPYSSEVSITTPP